MMWFRRILLRQVPSTSMDLRHEIRWFATAVGHVEQNLDHFTKVYTTGYSFFDQNGNRIAKYGVFWGPNDPRNAIRTLPGSTNVAATLTAILEVIHMAREEEPPPSLLIYSDLQSTEDLLKNLRDYAKRDFYLRRRDEKMKNAEILQDLFSAVQGLHLKIVYKPTFTPQNPNNYLIAKLAEEIRQKMAKKEEEEKANRQKENERNANNSKENFCRSENLAEDFARSSNHLPLNHALNEKGEIVRFERNWPKVHVAARCTEKDNFFSAGYCTHWPDGQFRGGRSFRFAPFPVTLFRAELAAIEEALREAVDASIQNVIIVTSSAHFMRAWSRRWECTKVVKADEGVERIEKSAFSGRIFFDRICDLCEQLSHVHFQFEKEDANAELAKELERKCAQGLSYPLVGKDLTEYRLEIDDLVQSKECRRDGIPIIRLFKSGTEFNAGYTWKSDDLNSANSCVGTPSVLVRILEEAVKRNQLEITIRADSEKLIKSFEARLEIWRRNGWRNRQHKRIGKLAEWENAWNLKQKVDVIWEFMDPPDDEDRKENEKIPKYKKASK